MKADYILWSAFSIALFIETIDQSKIRVYTVLNLRTEKRIVNVSIQTCK